MLVLTSCGSVRDQKISVRNVVGRRMNSELDFKLSGADIDHLDEKTVSEPHFKLQTTYRAA